MYQRSWSEAEVSPYSQALNVSVVFVVVSIPVVVAIVVVIVVVFVNDAAVSLLFLLPVFWIGFVVTKSNGTRQMRNGTGDVIALNEKRIAFKYILENQKKKRKQTKTK